MFPFSKVHLIFTFTKKFMHLCLSWKCVSSSESETGHPGQRKVQREVTYVAIKKKTKKKTEMVKKKKKNCQ